MSKLIMCRGLPASGKSTWAKAQVASSNGRIKRVNRDDLRAMLDCSEWSKSNEKFVVRVRDLIIHNAFLEGKSVIVDDTNLTHYHEKDLRIIADRFSESEVQFEIMVFDTSFEECMRRNALREGLARVPDDAMWRLKKDWDKLNGNLHNK